MFELILHIGTHKTGTTAIQDFLRSNQKSIFNQSSHVFINNYNFNNLRSIKDFKQLSDAMLNLQKNYIVSCERLSGNMFSGYTDVGEILSCFSKLEEFYKITVIVFYREQVSFLESAYSQFIHQGGFGDIDSFLTNFNLESIKYTQHLNLIKQALPKAVIIAKAYHPKETLSDFLAQCKINLPTDSTNPNINQSYDFDAINFASKVNEYLSDKEKLKLRKMLQPVLYKTQSDKRKVMSLQKAAKLLEFYVEDNKKLEKEFKINLPKPSQHVEGNVKIDEIGVLTKLLLNSQQPSSKMFPYYLKLEFFLLSILNKTKEIFR